jgi:hypothetical protein
LSPGIVAAPSTATIAAPPPGTPHCNSAGALAEDESAARIPSADKAAYAAAGVIALAVLLDFRLAL